MTIRTDANCPGCTVPLEERVYLPRDWKEGDPVPENVTWHIDVTCPKLRFAQYEDKKWARAYFDNNGKFVKYE